MRKNLIARLLVLAMALSMLPIAAQALDMGRSVSRAVYDDPYRDDPYHNVGNDTIVPEPVEAVIVPAPAEAFKESDVEVDINGSGQAVVQVAVRANVSNNAATVSLTYSNVSALVSQALSSKASAVVLNVNSGNAARVVVSAPAAALKKVAAAGADLCVQSQVAEVTVPSAALAALPEDAKKVSVSARRNGNGTYDIGLSVDDALLDDISGGLKVSLTTTIPEDQIEDVIFTRTDRSEDSLYFTIRAGRLNVTMAASGKLYIVKVK